MSSDRTALGDRMKAHEQVTKTTLPAREYVEAKTRAAELFEEGVTAYQVGPRLGVDRSTAYGWHRRWRDGGIDRLLERPERYGLEALSEVEAAVLDGLMLGDGSLVMGKHSRHASLMITRTSRDLDYLKWTGEVFAGRVTQRGIKVRQIADERTGKTYGSAQLRTRHDRALTPQRERWYPTGAKIVPADLSLTPLALAVWFADDGSVSASSRRSPDVKLATHAFPEGDTRRLAAMLSDRYAGAFHVYREGALDQHTIRAFGSPAKALLRDIDPVFPPLARKSDRWRLSELLTERTPPPDCPRCSSSRVYRWARSSKGVQRFKCTDCMRAFSEHYERPSRNPGGKMEQVAA